MKTNCSKCSTSDLKNRLRGRYFGAQSEIRIVTPIQKEAADKIEELENALIEAMEWNWLDDENMPMIIVEKCEKALS